MMIMQWPTALVGWFILTLSLVVADSAISGKILTSGLISHNVPPSEIEALHAVFNSTNGHNWNWRNASEGRVWVFDASANPCTDNWQGVSCSLLPPLNVVNLTLFDFNLHGSLPNELGNLTKLTFLRIAQNNGLVGTLPHTLSKLSRLDALDISASAITGTIPPSFIGMQDLLSLMLYENHLTGHIPEAFCSLTKLTGLNLAFNRLNGSFPSCFCNSTQMLALALNNNTLSGTIPNCLSNLKYMFAMDLSQNYFSGTIPTALGSMFQMRQLSLYSNRLSGSMPASLGNLTHLIGLYAYSNALTGTIPTSFEKLLTLTHLDLEKNHLSGTFPQLLTRLTNLIEIDFTGNKFSGSLPDSIVQLSNLTYLEVDKCFLTGTLPLRLGLLSQLQYIQLYSNYFTGPLPISLTNLTQLQSFEISHNALTGSIPAEMGRLIKLKYVWLNDNHLIGSIPQSLAAMKSLQEIFLSNNQLTGNLYDVFDPNGQTDLVTIELSGNQLTGSLPHTIYALPSLQTFAAVSNCIVTALTADICVCTSLVALALDGLQSSRKCQQKILPRLSASYMVPHPIKGGIPACLFSMPSLSTLHLSGNGITGSLPWNLTISPTLVDLSLSHNSLTGTIPASVQTRQWYNLDLAYNRLTGTLSRHFAQQTLNYSSYSQFDGSTDPAATVALALENNRLSGKIPGAIMSYSNVSVLGSNMFFCNLAADDLPHHDNGRDKYACGSDEFNAPYYTWLAILVGGVVVVCASAINVRWKLWLEKTRKWLAVVDGYADFAHITAPIPSLANVMFVFDSSCLLTAATAGYVLVVLLPFYIASSYYYGTFTFKFAWTVSAAFLSGAVPTAIEMSLLLLLVALLMYLVHLLCMRFQSKSRTTRAGRWSLRFLTSKTVSERRSLTRRIGAYTLFMFCSFMVVIGVNIAYVYVALYGSKHILLLSQILLSFFKLFWNTFCARHLMRWTVRVVFQSADDSGEMEGTRGSELMFALLLVALVNNIGIPCLVTAVISPNCFYNLFVPAPAIQTTYQYQYCNLINNHNGQCYSSEYTYGTTVYDPPFVYSYQCSSSFITYYAPAFVFLCITATILSPLSEAITLWAHSRLPVESREKKLLLHVTPRILQPIHENQKPSSSQQKSGPYFDANHHIVTLLSYFGILLTFGTVFPPLGVAMAITLFVSARTEKLKLGRYLTQAHKQGCSFCADIIEAECRCSGGAEMLQLAVHLIITVSCWFYTLFLFDTLGDEQGLNRTYWVLIAVPLTPLALCAAAATLQVARAPNPSPGLSADQDCSSSVEMGITLSPMVALGDARL